MARNEIRIKKAKQSDVKGLQGRLRQSDKNEILAGTGTDPDHAINLAYKHSEMAWTAKRRGKVIAMFGVARPSMMSDWGSPWMLGSDELDTVGIEIARQTRYYVDVMSKNFKHLENFVDARHTKSIRWLKWCGFTVDEAKPWGVAGLPFHKFSK